MLSLAILLKNEENRFIQKSILGMKIKLNVEFQFISYLSVFRLFWGDHT